VVSVTEPFGLLSRPEPLLFLPSISSVVLTRLSGPREQRQNWSQIRYTYFLGNVNFRELNSDPKITPPPPSPQTQTYFGFGPKNILDLRFLLP
jgi:hypothetical protein